MRLRTAGRIVAWGFVLFALSANAINGRTTYQAKIIKHDGYPLEAVNVHFRFTVLDPAGTCVLYIEDYVPINMSNSGGFISFPLGTGVVSFPASSTSMSFQNAFDNSVASHACLDLSSYNPSPTDDRKIVMQFNDGAGWQSIPAMTINAVPYAMYASRANNSSALNGKSDTDFLQKASDIPTCAAGKMLYFNMATFSCVDLPTSAGIASVSVSGSALSITGTASDPVITISAATMSSDGYLTSLDYAEFKAKLAASATQIADTLGFAPVSGAAVATQIASSNLSGDVSGTISANSVVSVGGKSASQIATSVDDTLAATSSATASTLVKRDSNAESSFNGVSIYKPSTSFSVKLQANTSLSANYVLTLPQTAGSNGQVLSTDGSGNLSWINAATGSVTSVSATSPLSSTGGSTPSISISQATSSTDGYLSASDWTTFNNKQNATSAAIIATLGYTPADSAVSIDLGSTSATGIIADARLADQSNVVSGTQYTKVTVDGKGRVTSGAQLSASDVTTALGYTPGNSTSGVTSLNGSTSQTQTFVTGITGTVFGISSVNGIHTFNIPFAASGSVTGGLLSNADYSTFMGKVASSAASIAEVLGYVPAASGSAGVGTLLSANNLSDVASASAARNNLGLGDLATLNFLDLGSVLASGTLSASKLADSGVTAGTYTKVTVDSKGRVTSSSSLSSSDVTTALGYAPVSSAAIGITSLNGSSSATQTFASGTAGTAFSLTTLNGVHTLNIPLASAASVTGGLLSNADYTTFMGKVASSAASIAEVLGYVPAASGSAGVGTLLSANNLSDVASASAARNNLGLGSVAILNSIDLSSTQASGIIADARLADQSNVVSGTQYTKVTVDGKGRVTSGAQLSASDVTTALGYTPGDATGAAGGDLSGNYPNPSVIRLRGVSISATTPTMAGQMLRYDGTQWVPNFVSMLDLRSNVTGTQSLATNCLASQTLTFNSATDSLACSNIAISSSQVSGLGTFATANSIDLGSASATGIIADARLADQSNVTSGTQYTKLTVDGKGRVVSGAQLASSDVVTALGYTPANAASAGITTLNGSSSSTQTFASGTAGTAFSLSTLNGVHTLNIPLASAASVTGGLLSNADYSTFMGKVASSAASIAEVLGYVPAASGSAGVGTLLSANNLSDVASATVARNNLGLGSLATLNFIDLGSSYASGTLAIARLPSFVGDATIAAASNTIVLSNSGVTAGTYTKITVDSKGRVTSSSALASGDVVTALGYTPANAASAGVTTLNGSASATQSFANSLTGTAPVFSTANGVHTLNIPYASVGTTTAGLISNSEYSTFMGKVASSAVSIAQVLGYVPAASGATAIDVTALKIANNLSDVASATIARNNLGLGSLATLNFLDLGSVLASGTLSVSKLADSGVVAGTYTKVTVDSKGRVTSSSSLSSSDVTTALGYAPVSSAAIGITSLNGSTSATQTFASGTAGTAFSLSTLNGVHTLNIPLASAASVAGGLVSNADYSTFMGKVASSAASISQVLGYVPAASGSIVGSQWATSGTTINYMTGNVGIGTANPLSGLDLGTNYFNGTPTTLPELINKITLWSNAGTSYYGLGISSSSLNLTAGQASGKIAFYTGGANERMRIDNAGNVGIGTSAPTSLLHVFGDAGVNVGTIRVDQPTAPDGTTNKGPHVFFRSGGTLRGWMGYFDQSVHGNGTQFNIKSVGSIGFGTGSTGAANTMTVSGGNVGVGTTTPVTKLEVSGGIRISMESATCATSYAGTLRYNAGSVEYCNGSTWAAFGVSGAGLTSLNGSTSATQTFASGTAGTAFSLSTLNGVHTLNIPLASAASVTGGLLSNADYSTFMGKVASSAASIAQVLGYVPASATALGNYLVRSNNLSDLTSSATARTNLGLGTLAVSDTINLGSASATGTLSAARMPALSGDVTTVSGSVAATVARIRGISVSATAPTSGQVLAYNGATNSWAPATVSGAGGSSQWTTNGSAIHYNTGYVGIGESNPTFKLSLTGTASTSDRKIGINGNQVIYLPDQSGSVFSGSLFVGTGGGSLSHTSGSQGQNNTGVGIGALSSVTTGYENTANGFYSLYSNTSGYWNTANGAWALQVNTTGHQNTANGVGTLQSNTTGFQNTANGSWALNLNVTGVRNTANGYYSLYSNTTGMDNAANGANALKDNTIGSANVGVGTLALAYNKTKSESTAIGYYSMYYADDVSATATPSYNTAIGAYSMQGSGSPSANTGLRNTALGHSALMNMSSGSNNIGIGYNAGSGITTGSFNIVIGSTSGGAIATSSNNILLADGQGNERMRINSSGYVGIGTSTPSEELEVSGSIKIVDGNQGAGKVLTSDASGVASWQTPSSGGFAGAVNVSSTPYTITSSDSSKAFYYSNNANGVINLPALSGVSDGFSITIHRQVAKNLTITPNGSDKFPGGVSTIEMQGKNLQSVTLMKLGSLWALSNQTEECTVGQECWTADATGGMKQIFVGTYNGKQYFTTPGGCTNSATPTCAGGTDTVTKAWAVSAGTTAHNVNAVATDSFTDGVSQSAYLAANYTDTDAAKFCENMTYAGYTDWYLPANKELSFLYQQSHNISGFLHSGLYWSSTEDNATSAWPFRFGNGYMLSATKTGVNNVRCVRRF